MADADGDWDEEEGYRFKPKIGEHPERDRVSLPSKDRGHSKGNPVLRRDFDLEHMHYDFPETHGYLRKSLDDLNFMTQRIKAMKKEKEEKDSGDRETQRVTIRKRQDRDRDRSVRHEQMRRSSEYRRRKIRTKAINAVISDLRDKGYSDSFIRSNMDLIKRKVDQFLED